MTATNVRSEKLDLRLTADAKRTLSAAAKATRRTMSKFVLESALARAQEALPDRQHFGLDAERWKAFLEALEAPTQRHDRSMSISTSSNRRAIPCTSSCW